MTRSTPWLPLAAGLLLILGAEAPVDRAAAGPPDDFALRDGDSVVFLGDSITAAGTYGRIVESYTLLRFPNRRVRFHNAGWGGDTAAGGLARLDRDVLPFRPTVLIVAYGVNDIGWGVKADAPHKQAYLDGIKGIVQKAQAAGARVFVCSAAATAEDPETAESGFLQTMCDEGMALARSLGARSIDVQRSMRDVQRRMAKANAEAEAKADAPIKPEGRHTLHVADGVHLNDVGQLAMAVAILDGLGAPADVSSAVLDFADPSSVQSAGCSIDGVRVAADADANAPRLEFDRLDEGLPLNLGLFGALQYRFVPVPDLLNRYLLTVRNLPAGSYAVSADGRPLGRWTAEALASGVNLASATADSWEPGGPWEAAAWALADLVQARFQLGRVPPSLARHLPDSPALPELRERADEASRRIEDLQHILVAPRPFHFVVEKVEPKESR